MRDRISHTIALAAVATLLAACGGAPAANAPKPASGGSPPATAAQPAPSEPEGASKPLQKVTLRLDWIASGYHSPYVLAKDKGYYRDAGFDVDIQEGKGSLVGAETVANGSDAFATVDAGTAAILISKGAAIKVLAVFIQQSPLAFIYNPPFRLNDLHQLRGKTILTTSGSALYKVLPAVLSAAGMHLSDVKISFADPSTYARALTQNPDLIVLGFDNDDLQEVQKLDPKAEFTPYAQFGVNPYSIGLITSTKRLQDDPDGVRRFVAATIKGWQDTLRDPEAAIDLLLKQFPQADRDVMTAGLKQAVTMLHTPATQGKPLGWTAESDWKETVDVLHKYGGLDPVRPLDVYYTNDFLPNG